MEHIKIDKKERRGIFVFICILTLLQVFKFYHYHLGNSESQLELGISEIVEKHNLNPIKPTGSQETKDSTVAQLEIKEFDQLTKKEKSSFPRSNTTKKIKISNKKPPKAFDPNKAQAQDFEPFDLPDFIVQRILKFRSKGGRFYKKEDLKKIYGLSEQQYLKISPYITIEDIGQALTKKSLPVLSFIDVNAATQEEFQSLRGIGPVLSKRIVKFRDLLGGFYDITQISETFGLPDSTYQSIEKHLMLHTPFSKIAINNIDVESLAKHPYISYKLAKIILNYRAQHGPFDTKTQLLEIKIIDQKTFDKIAPYISLDPAHNTTS